MAARRILDTYRPRIPCFNDDVQGTGCVTLAAIVAGLHVSHQKLSDLRMVIFGAAVQAPGLRIKCGTPLPPKGASARKTQRSIFGEAAGSLLGNRNGVTDTSVTGSSTSRAS